MVTRFNARHGQEGTNMEPRNIYWQDEDMWLGYLKEYPDYMTQGETIKEYFQIYH